jgi:hypothetical protein
MVSHLSLKHCIFSIVLILLMNCFEQSKSSEIVPLNPLKLCTASVLFSHEKKNDNYTKVFAKEDEHFLSFCSDISYFRSMTALKVKSEREHQQYKPSSFLDGGNEER